MARFALASLVVCLGIQSVACSSSTEPAPALETPPGDTPPGDTLPETGEPTPDPVEDACTTQTKKLQARLDKAHPDDTDAVLAIRDPECGARVLTSGPQHLGPKHLHRIASVTKTYVAALVLELMKDGALSLDDTVTKWVDFPSLAAVTVRQLLNHTSGIFNYTDDPDFRNNATTMECTPRKLVDIALENPPYQEPGKRHQYSNTNYVLLGMIAESAGRGNLAALLRERVFKKAGLTETFLDGQEPVTMELAKGYAADGEDMTNILHPSCGGADGGIVATPGDTALWIEKLGNGTFYDAATQTLAFTTVPTESADVDYGLGVMTFAKRITGPAESSAIGHTGGAPGYHTQAFYLAGRQATIVSIVDSDAASANDITVAALFALYR